MNYAWSSLQERNKVSITSDTREAMYSKPRERARIGNIATVQGGADKNDFLEEKAFELDLEGWEGMGHVDMKKGEDRAVGITGSRSCYIPSRRETR